jgi:hypothetical protein
MVSDSINNVLIIARKVDSNNTKKIAVILTMALIIYHGILHFSFGKTYYFSSIYV